MRHYLVSVAVALVLMPVAVVAAYDRHTSLTVYWLTSRDTISVHGFVTLAESDADSGLTLLLNPSTAIRGMYFHVEGDSIKAQVERVGGDTIVVARPSESPTALSRVLSFDLSFPIDKNSDSLIMLDRGNRWYPVSPRGLTKVTIYLYWSGDEDVFSTGNEEIHLSGGIMLQQFITTIPVYKIPLVIAKKHYYRNCRREVGEHEISLNYFSISDSAAQKVLAEAATAFGFYQNLLGDYHHKKLTILEVPNFEGTNIGTGILMIGTPTMKAIAAGHYESLTLTIASQWFGAGVFCEFSSKGFWFMTLSFSHYLRMLYEGRELDSAAFAAKIEGNLATYNKIAGTENDIPIIDIVRPDSREKGMVIYSKGPWLVHQFAACIGTGRMTRAIREIYSKFVGKVISIEQLTAALSAVDKACADRLIVALGKVGL